MLGFTLAEVLITLVIIGVIAAITVPNMIQKYQWKQYKTGLLKAINVLNQGLNSYYIKNGNKPECGYYNNGSGYKYTDCAALYNSFLKSLNVQKYCVNNAYSNGCIPKYKGIETVSAENGRSEEAINTLKGGCHGFTQSNLLSKTAFITTDGMIFLPFNLSDPVYIVDTNGFKSPNKFGYDIHFLYIRYKSNNKDSLFMPFTGGCAFFEKGGISTQELLKKVV